MMLFSVTQRHIDRGDPSTLRFCPIALAAQEALGIDEIDVDGIEMIVFKPGQSVDRYDLPDEAISFIQDYEDELPLEPFEFEITNAD